MDFLPTAYSHCINGRISINNTAATAVRVGTSNLAGRKWLMIMNSSDEPIYWGSQYLVDGTPTTVTAYVLGRYCQKMATGDMIWLPVADTITIYARAHSGVQNIRIVELA